MTAIDLAAKRHTRAMWKRSQFAADVAQALYRAYRNHDDADLYELTAVQQMPYHQEAEAAILRLLERR